MGKVCNGGCSETEGNACFVLFLQSGTKINNVDEFKYVPFISPLIQLLGLKSGKQK